VAQFLIAEFSWPETTFLMDEQKHLRLVTVTKVERGCDMTEKDKPTLLLEHYLKKF